MTGAAAPAADLIIDEVFHQGREMFRRSHTVVATADPEQMVRGCLAASTANYGTVSEQMIVRYATELVLTSKFDHGWSTFTLRPNQPPKAP